MYLLDTNIISASAPGKPDRDIWSAWFIEASELLYLSVVSASEITSGIVKAEREGATRKAAALRQWWTAVEYLYDDRILPFDLQAAYLAGAILDRARAHDPGFQDIVIAATAEAHGLTIVTANERHFRPLGVAMVNPSTALPPIPH